MVARQMGEGPPLVALKQQPGDAPPTPHTPARVRDEWSERVGAKRICENFFFFWFVAQKRPLRSNMPRWPPLPSPSLPYSAQIELTAKHDEIGN